jgi:hypothetical protein
MQHKGGGKGREQSNFNFSLLRCCQGQAASFIRGVNGR